MAKRKKKAVPVEVVGSSPSGPRQKRVNVGVEEADNGYIVHTSCEGIGKHPSGYESKDHVATNYATAMRIANTHLNSISKKMRSKKHSNRKIVTAK